MANVAVAEAIAKGIGSSVTALESALVGCDEGDTSALVGALKSLSARLKNAAARLDHDTDPLQDRSPPTRRRSASHPLRRESLTPPPRLGSQAEAGNLIQRPKSASPTKFLGDLHLRRPSSETLGVDDDDFIPLPPALAHRSRPDTRSALRSSEVQTGDRMREISLRRRTLALGTARAADSDVLPEARTYPPTKSLEKSLRTMFDRNVVLAPRTEEWMQSLSSSDDASLSIRSRRRRNALRKLAMWLTSRRTTGSQLSPQRSPKPQRPSGQFAAFLPVKTSRGVETQETKDPSSFESKIEAPVPFWPPTTDGIAQNHRLSSSEPRNVNGFITIEPRPSEDDDDDDDDAAAASRLGRQCRVAERAVDLLYKLAKARGTRGGVVEAVAAAMGGLALPTLVVTARRLARAAVANPDEAAALASVARAALDLATVAAHAAKLPDVDLSDRARDRARTMIFHRFLRPADRDALRRRRARKRVAGSLELDAVSALFSSALEASEAALATAADLKDHQQPVRRAREQAAEDLEKITSKIVERRAASVDLAVSVSRLAVVALGYACEAASLLAPRLPARPDQPPWDDMDDDDDDEDDRDDPDPKRLVASVAIAALEALLERRDADAAAADAAAHAVADACANLRMLAAGDSATGTNDHLSRDLEAIAALVGAALLEREAASQGTTSGILSAAAASEVYRGHLHVALAHVLGSRNYFRSGEPSKRRRRLLPAGNDDDDDADDDAAATNGGGVEYAEVYAVSEAAWTRVCVDAASASTPWVRLGAASALSAAASGAACRDDAFFDDFLRGAGFLTFSSNRDGSSFLPGSVETRRAARYHHEPSEHLVVQSIETTLAALLRLGSRRTGAHALAKSSVVEVIARDDRVWTPPDEARPRCLCLALEVVRQLLRQLPAHASLRQQSQDLVYARDRVLSRVLLDDARARPLTLAAFRARAAYVGVLASLAASARDDHRRARRAAAVVEDARRASMLWSLLGAAATQAPYAPLPPWPDAHPAPWRDDDASWWRDVRPAPASEENLRASMPTTSPSSAAHSNWTAFDDDKLRCCVATWARLVDFARHQVALPEFDLDALVATLRKAAAIRRGTLCDADTLAAHELRATADFALEASLLALRDRLCPPETATIAPPGAPQDPDQPRAADPRTERRLHAAAVLAALDLVTFTDDDDFVSRLKKRLTTVLSLDV